VKTPKALANFSQIAIDEQDTPKAFANFSSDRNDEQDTPKAFANFIPGLERSDNPG